LNIKKAFKGLIYLPLILLFLISSHSIATDIILGVHYNYKNEHLGIGVNNANYKTDLVVAACPALDNAELKNIQRATMDLLLVCNAVRDAGIADRLILKSYPNIARGVREVAVGHFDMISQTLFSADHIHISDKSLLVTDPVIRSGEFEVGVFTTRNRPDILKLRNIEDFRQLTGVTVQSWLIDQTIMKELGIQTVSLLNKRGVIAKFIAAKRGDFTFSYLREPVVTRIGGELIRIDGIKVSFHQERSFIVSKSNISLLTAVNSYLRKLRRKEQDEVLAAYIHAGFIAPEFNHWTDLADEIQKE
jgi:hypothetical protein